MIISELKKEVVDLLLARVSGAVDEYRSQWDIDLEALFEVRSALENLEARKQSLEGEWSKLRPVVNSELQRKNVIDRELRKLEKVLSGTRKQIEVLTARLTAIESFGYPSPLLNFISAFDNKPSYVEMIKTRSDLAKEKKELKGK